MRRQVAAALAILILAGTLPLAPAASEVKPRASIERALLDIPALARGGHLDSDGRVGVIVMLDVPGAETESPSFRASRDAFLATAHLLAPARIHSLHLAGGVAMRVDARDIPALATTARVKHVSLDHHVEAQLDVTRSLLGADAAAGYVDAQGWAFDGTGVRVAVLDTGIYCGHAAFAGRIEEFVNYIEPTETQCYDEANSHGTAVTGIIAADASLRGIAPRVSIGMYKVLDGNLGGTESVVILALQDAVARAYPVISMSLGYPCAPSCGSDRSPMTAAAEAIDSALIVAAAGNDGALRPSGTVRTPAVAGNVLAVGASHRADVQLFRWDGSNSCRQEDANNSHVACFSSRGPTPDGRTKPDVVAPGVWINTTCSIAGCYTYDFGLPEFATGTSFATPHVAGIAALVIQKHPDWTPEQVKRKIMASAIDLGLPSNTQGTGRAHALNSLDDIAPTLIASESIAINRTSASVPWVCVDGADVSNPATGIRQFRYAVDNSAWTNVSTFENASDLALTLSAGPHSVTLACTDRGGNPSAVATTSVLVDLTAPAASITSMPASPDGADGWFRTAPLVSVHCTDNASGCASVGGCATLSVTCEAVAGEIEFDLGEGEWFVRALAQDAAGNAAQAEASFRVDLHAPSTTAQFDATPVSGWHIANVTYSFTCEDLGPSDCVGTRHTVLTDGAVVTQEGPGPFTLDLDGIHEVEWASRDAAGNAEPPVAAFVRIDRGAPHVAVTPDSHDEETAPFNVTLACTDALSGCQSLRATLDGGEWIDASNVPFFIPWGHHNLTYVAEDVAGNALGPVTRHYAVGLPPLVEIVSPGANGIYAAGQSITPTGFGFRIGIGEVHVVANVTFRGGSTSLVDLYVDGVLYGAMDPPPAGKSGFYSIDWTPPTPPKSHQLTVRARAAPGLEAEATTGLVAISPPG